jgi:hypothetical protein
MRINNWNKGYSFVILHKRVPFISSLRYTFKV